MLCQQQTVQCAVIESTLVSCIVPGALCGWSPQMHTAQHKSPRRDTVRCKSSMLRLSETHDVVSLGCLRISYQPAVLCCA